MTRWILAAGLAVALAAGAAQAQTPPAALFTDPPVDTAHPARAETLHIPTGGVKVNGLAYIAAGPGTHPTVVLFHGMPGIEKNLDLAQAIRRDGWNVVTLNYRGSWGSPGPYSFKGNLADAKAAHPSPGAAHQRCDACHTGTTVAQLTPTRTFCATCHAPKATNHFDQKQCTTCHFLVEPGAYRARLTTPPR